MTEDGRAIGPAARVGAPEDPVRDAVEIRGVDSDESLTQAGEAARVTERGFYRLVALDESGLRAHDRQAFSTLERAEEWRDEHTGVLLGITRHEELAPDVVMVDGEWLGPVQDATRYGRPRYRGNSRSSVEVAPGIGSASLVVHTQPDWWIGELFLDSVGSGWVWSGQEMLQVTDHRICDSAPPGYRGLYAWSLQATREFRFELRLGASCALMPLTASQRTRWRLSRLAAYAVLERPDQVDAPGGSGLIRMPWRAVAVSARQVLELFQEDRLRPETEKLHIYRGARLAPEGLVALGPDGYTTLEGARKAVEALGWEKNRVCAVTHCVGLPADVTRLDGRSFESGRDRIAPGAGRDVRWVDPSGAGVPVVDEDGKGFVLGRSGLVRVAGGLVADSLAELHGAPAWLYRVFAKVELEPMTPHVHGVVVKVNRSEVEAWGLPDGTKAVLLLRGQGARSVTWRCLDGDAFKSLRSEDALSVRRYGGRNQLPVGVDAGTAGVGEG